MSGEKSGNDSIVKIHDLNFKKYIDADAIQERITAIGQELTDQYAHKSPLFIGILNGAFVFMADLLRACDIDCELAFLRLSSYDGLQSTGAVNTKIGLDTDIEGRHLIVVEDIIDSGRTLRAFLPFLKKQNPASVLVVTLLLKPEMLRHELQIDYTGFKIPPKFVVGYGLDYNGLGRNLPSVYQLIE